MKKNILLVFGLIMASSEAFASIVQSTTGLSSPQTTITFDEFSIATNTVITNQYQSLGATFAPNLVQTPQSSSGFPNLAGGNLGNFSPVVDPFYISFTGVQMDVAFVMVTNPGTSTFTTLLNNVVVEAASFSTDFTSSNNWYVFNGTFDQIRVDVGGSNSAMLMDNLQLSNRVPVPATLALLGLGVAGIGYQRRKRETTA